MGEDEVPYPQAPRRRKFRGLLTDPCPGLVPGGGHVRTVGRRGVPERDPAIFDGDVSVDSRISGFHHRTAGPESPPRSQRRGPLRARGPRRRPGREGCATRPPTTGGRRAGSSLRWPLRSAGLGGPRTWPLEPERCRLAVEARGGGRRPAARRGRCTGVPASSVRLRSSHARRDNEPVPGTRPARRSDNGSTWTGGSPLVTLKRSTATSTL